jgi:F0F1-type ATP synthase delta subunit
MIDSYTRTLEIVAETADEATAERAVQKLIVHLKSRGRTKLLPSISRELKKIQSKRKSLDAVVEVAHKDESKKALEEARAQGIDAQKTVVNTSLICGWRGRKDGLLVDRSGKRALVDLYRRITS